jgi:D-beta-D-heptose 7-phosphate kinase/D-beta-D-heptose 1-phosphate adenosyltransferase
MIGKYIWVNGCFDVLHRGHIELFKYAKSLGDYLVVGIDDDKRVRAFKGNRRPINCLEDRMEILRSIKYIDNVVEFNSDEELEAQVLLSGAEVMVVGSDYKNKKVIGSQHVKEVKFYRKIDGYSTTKILERSSRW